MYADLNSAPGCVCCAFVYILTYWQRRQDNTPRQTICTGWSSRLLIPSLLVWAAGIVFNLFVIPQNWFRLAKKKSRHEIDQKRTQPANLTTATETNNISMISPHNLTSQPHTTTTPLNPLNLTSQTHLTNSPYNLTWQPYNTTSSCGEQRDVCWSIENIARESGVSILTASYTGLYRTLG